MKFFKGPGRSKSSFTFFEVGFHGDMYLLALVDYLMKQEVELFIETGTNVGSTLAYVARTFPNLLCYSCEPDKEAYKNAISNTKGLKNVKLYNITSQEMIEKIKGEHTDFFGKKTFFWLDAHSYGFDWPLKEEVKFVSENFKSAYLMIDDFKVPNNHLFNYDRYKDQLCAHEFIVDQIGQRPCQLYYPNYSEKTSSFHPLQGWGLYVFGETMNFPQEILEFVLEVK